MNIINKYIEKITYYDNLINNMTGENKWHF